MLHGRNIVILNDEGTALIACATSCEIDKNCEAVEVSGPQSGESREYIKGRESWSLTINRLLSASLEDLERVGSTVTVRVQVVGETSYRSGRALVQQCKLTATRGNLAQGSLVLLGSGSLSLQTD